MFKFTKESFFVNLNKNFHKNPHENEIIRSQRGIPANPLNPSEAPEHPLDPPLEFACIDVASCDSVHDVSLFVSKPVFRVSDDTNQAVHLQKTVRGLKFWL